MKTPDREPVRQVSSPILEESGGAGPFTYALIAILIGGVGFLVGISVHLLILASEGNAASQTLIWLSVLALLLYSIRSIRRYRRVARRSSSFDALQGMTISPDRPDQQPVPDEEISSSPVDSQSEHPSQDPPSSEH